MSIAKSNTEFAAIILLKVVHSMLTTLLPPSALYVDTCHHSGLLASVQDEYISTTMSSVLSKMQSVSSYSRSKLKYFSAFVLDTGC